jgi:hypothetical protein
MEERRGPGCLRHAGGDPGGRDPDEDRPGQLRRSPAEQVVKPGSRGRVPTPIAYTGPGRLRDRFHAPWKSIFQSDWIAFLPSYDHS